MKVYIDGQECTDIIGAGNSSAILSAVSGRISKAGRVMTEIRLDDVVMEEEAFLSVSGGLVAQFTSRPVHDLVMESLDEALKYIPRLTKGFEEIALHFEQNELTAGEGKLADGAEGLDWLLQVFQKCSSLLAVNDDDNKGLSELKDALTKSISSLGIYHSEKKYLQMAFCIRERLVSELEKLSIHIQRLRNLASSTQ